MDEVSDGTWKHWEAERQHLPLWSHPVWWCLAAEEQTNLHTHTSTHDLYISCVRVRVLECVCMCVRIGNGKVDLLKWKYQETRN